MKKFAIGIVAVGAFSSAASGSAGTAGAVRINPTQTDTAFVDVSCPTHD